MAPGHLCPKPLTGVICRTSTTVRESPSKPTPPFWGLWRIREAHEEEHCWRKTRKSKGKGGSEPGGWTWGMGLLRWLQGWLGTADLINVGQTLNQLVRGGGNGCQCPFSERAVTSQTAAQESLHGSRSGSQRSHWE